jgi:hypothetical protein
MGGEATKVAENFRDLIHRKRTGLTIEGGGTFCMSSVLLDISSCMKDFREVDNVRHRYENAVTTRTASSGECLYPAVTVVSNRIS